MAMRSMEVLGPRFDFLDFSLAGGGHDVGTKWHRNKSGLSRLLEIFGMLATSKRDKGAVPALLSFVACRGFHSAKRLALGLSVPCMLQSGDAVVPILIHACLSTAL